MLCSNHRRGTHLLVRREDCEPCARGLVLIWGAERPEGDGAAAKLGEPALEFRLSGVVGQTAHVQNLAALGEERADVSSCIHWLC